MLVAGAAAIEIAGAVREEATEDAVLGVEDGQVLIGDHFEFYGAGARRARSATCAAFKSCQGVMRSRPIARKAAVVTELAALRLKAPMRGGCRCAVRACSMPGGSQKDGAVETEQELDDALLDRA
jgi:hypothetical protein